MTLKLHVFLIHKALLSSVTNETDWAQDVHMTSWISFADLTYIQFRL